MLRAKPSSLEWEKMPSLSENFYYFVEFKYVTVLVP